MSGYLTNRTDAQRAAEQDWLDRWTEGPTQNAATVLSPGTPAPDLALPDQDGAVRRLGEFWAAGPALIMFWRHFGCSCGLERARRLVDEYDAYRRAKLTPVIIAQGEPGRAAQYRREQGIPCPILSDPGLEAYQRFGVGHWAVEQVLFDAPPEYWEHPRNLGIALQDERRRQGRPPVDDPWRATAEFVVAPSGRIRLAHVYQHCEDFPEPRVLTTAARMTARSGK